MSPSPLHPGSLIWGCPSSSGALLDRSLGDVYTPYVCRTTEVLPFVALVFIDLFIYMTLRSASLVFTKNVRMGTFIPLPVFKGMNTITPLLPYHYIIG
jgi:hypothetical protein